MLNLFAYLTLGYAVLMFFSVLNVLINIESYRANYYNPHNPEARFSVTRVVGTKLVVIFFALLIASQLNPSLLN